MKIIKEKSLNPMVDRMIEELTSDENTLRFGPWCMHPYNERKRLIYYNKLLKEIKGNNKCAVCRAREI